MSEGQAEPTLPGDAEELVRVQGELDELREECAELKRELAESGGENDFRYQVILLLLSLLLRNEMPLKRVEDIVAEAMALMQIGRDSTGNAFEILLKWKQLDDIAGGWFRQIRDAFEDDYVKWDCEGLKP